MKNINRRNFLKTSIAAGLAASISTSSSFADGTAENPNIVLIICDQMVIDAVSAYNNHYSHSAYLAHWIDTPNMDRMVTNGYSFMQSYSAHPVCSPDRACIFTGRASMENGVIANNIGIAQNIPNMGQWFQDNTAYRRYYCGKWHAGGQWNSPNVTGSRKIPGFDTIPVAGQGVNMDPQISDSVSAFLKNYNEADPFLVVAGFMHPHDICYWMIEDKHVAKKNEFNLSLPPLPPNNDTLYPDLWANTPQKSYSDIEWQNYLYDYCRQVELLDAELGSILDAVDTRADAENTIVIFTSDHGEGAGRFSCVQKNSALQNDSLVPLIFYAPGSRFQKNVQDNTHLASALDIMPTVCDLAGIAAPPNMRGNSLKGIIEGDPPASWRDFIYSDYGTTGRMICTSQHKYAYRYEYTGNVDLSYKLKSNGTNSQWINGGADLFVQYSGGCLFDLQNDPWEMNNLYGNSQYASIQTDLDQQLRDFQNTLLQNDHYDRN